MECRGAVCKNFEFALCNGWFSPASSGIVADTATVEAGLCERPAGEDVPTDPTGSKTQSNIK